MSQTNFDAWLGICIGMELAALAPRKNANGKQKLNAYRTQSEMQNMQLSEAAQAVENTQHTNYVRLL